MKVLHFLSLSAVLASVLGRPGNGRGNGYGKNMWNDGNGNGRNMWNNGNGRNGRGNGMTNGNNGNGFDSGHVRVFEYGP